jgi:hypothetical protein
MLSKPGPLALFENTVVGNRESQFRHLLLPAWQLLALRWLRLLLCGGGGWGGDFLTGLPWDFFHAL